MIVRILPDAEADLEAIGDYIARDNPHRALTFVKELRNMCNDLAEMSLAFPLVPRYEHMGVRHRVYGSYQIFYHVVDESALVDVLHVIHGARNYGSILFP